MTIFPPLLSPVFWERNGNIPALVRLMQGYLSKAGGEVAAGGHMQGVLGVFQRLLSSKAHDHEGECPLIMVLKVYLSVKALRCHYNEKPFKLLLGSFGTLTIPCHRVRDNGNRVASISWNIFVFHY